MIFNDPFLRHAKGEQFLDAFPILIIHTRLNRTFWFSENNTLCFFGRQRYAINGKSTLDVETQAKCALLNCRGSIGAGSEN